MKIPAAGMQRRLRKTPLNRGQRRAWWTQSEAITWVVLREETAVTKMKDAPDWGAERDLLEDLRYFPVVGEASPDVRQVELSVGGPLRPPTLRGDDDSASIDLLAS